MSDIRFCPKCGSTRKTPVSNTPPGTAFIGALGIGTFQCRDCEYEGVFPIVEESELENVRKEIKNVKKQIARE